MRCELVRDFHFEAAHRLPHVPPGHKCARMHGHSYRIEVSVIGPIDPALGWVVDFGDIDRVVSPVIAELDHRCLNDLEGLANPTSEMLAAWIWRRVRPVLPGLAAVTVAETESSRCTYRGEGEP